MSFSKHLYTAARDAIAAGETVGYVKRIGSKFVLYLDGKSLHGISSTHDNLDEAVAEAKHWGCNLTFLADHARRPIKRLKSGARETLWL